MFLKSKMEEIEKSVYLFPFIYKNTLYSKMYLHGYNKWKILIDYISVYMSVANRLVIRCIHAAAR